MLTTIHLEHRQNKRKGYSLNLRISLFAISLSVYMKRWASFPNSILSSLTKRARYLERGLIPRSIWLGQEWFSISWIEARTPSSWMPILMTSSVFGVFQELPISPQRLQLSITTQRAIWKTMKSPWRIILVERSKKYLIR